MPATIFPNWSDNLPPLTVLAGGKSERMGRPKGLLSFCGKPWLLEQLDAYRRAGGKEAAVVLGYDADVYLNALSCLNLKKETFRGSLKITTLINEKPRFGPFSTVQTGLSFFLKKGYASAAFIALDRPAPAPRVWQELTASLKDSVRMVYPVRNGADGHPVMLSRLFAEQIIAADPENMRMNRLRNELPSGTCLTVEQTDEETGLNLNTPEEWAAFAGKKKAAGIMNFAVKGAIRSGKTTRLKQIAEYLSGKGLKVGGIIQPERNGSYYARDILSGEEVLLAEKTNQEKDGMYYSFKPHAWHWAREKIIKARRTCDVLAVDELGRLEARGMGHLPFILEDLPDETVLCRLLSIRSDSFSSIGHALGDIALYSTGL